ncbi:MULTISPECIES: anti-sigma factor [unclassified Streptomyces]|uniref:anti-sigma factor n=1 Tax=unclassified Streptomyces TaxID=2593676 RepID=UPI0033AA3DE8|nr:anti-sigma factor [Streptomyces sp. NBC_01176]
MTTTADLHTLTGAYALHALPDQERAEFEEHLADCAACADEVGELAATAARLGLAVAAPPHPATKARVMARIPAVRQDVPRVHLPAPSRALTRRLGRWALAACVAGATGLAGTTVWQHSRADDAGRRASASRQRADDLAGVLSASDVTSRHVRLPGGATGTLLVSRSRDRAAFVASGMVVPPRGKVYQLWFDDSGTMRPAGLMDSHRVTQAVVLDGSPGGASAVGITVEPAGGSARPTSTPVALMELPV